MTGLRLAAPTAALIDAATGERLGGQALRDAIDAAARRAAALPNGIVFHGITPTTASVVDYLGTVASGRAVALLDPHLPGDTVRSWADRFAPAALNGVDGRDIDGYARHGDSWIRTAPAGPAPHPALGLLLATSGSTGEAKLVRLSTTAVTANARAIAEALRITPEDVAPTSLPLFYSYGLSVLHSHLTTGATVLLADGGVLADEFWRAVDAHGATSLSGVPHHYRLLDRIGWQPRRHPSLRTLTQAGGRLEPTRVAALADAAAEAGAVLHVMYGQTEATARMTVLPASALPTKLGSAGLPIPGGHIAVRTESGALTTEPDVTGEIVYTGPNVMLGYACDAADLARGDDLGGVLATGDLGHLDVDGFLWLTGRRARTGKIFGVRVNLDDIETIAADAAGRPVAVTPAADRVVVWCDGADNAITRRVRDRLKLALRLHGTGFDVRPLDALPVLPTGKVDYRRLEADS
ncbi:AMP-binding protein [Stackebrandtia soli]|uniref:AMP-binding protein n=1 Tax=Stackebrandtia soli TaxID=1892856 RepID=UPI0039ECE35C